MISKYRTAYLIGWFLLKRELKIYMSILLFSQKSNIGKKGNPDINNNGYPGGWGEKDSNESKTSEYTYLHYFDFCTMKDF